MLSCFFNWATIAITCSPFLLLSYLLRRRLTDKSTEIEKQLEGGLLDRYMKVFGKPKPLDQFQRYHRTWDYAAAALLLTLVVAAGAAAALLKVSVPLCLPAGSAALAKLPASSIAALGGAYVWGLYEALRRYDSTDLTATSLHMFWVRLVLVAVLGPLVGSLFGQAPAGLLVAFGLGAFPVRTLQNFVISKVDIAAVQPKAEGPTLHMISGISPPVLERLLDSDVHSVTQLASADPVRLLLRTNLEWRFILDLIDRAKLAVYVGDKLDAFRLAGIGGAIEMTAIFYRLRHDNLEIKDTAQGAIRYMGTILGSEDAARNLALEIHADPEVKLISDMWGVVADQGKLNAVAGVQP